MTRATRYDTHRLDTVEVMPSGDLRVPARFARTGVLTYRDAEGNAWGELVPAETLFDAASMQTARGIALTDLHPTEGRVTPETRRTVSVGHVGDTIARDGAYLSGAVYVTDPGAIKRVQEGTRRDVSCGYTCDFEETPGVLDGVPYVRVQKGRVYNHLGIGPEGWGRAGTDVSLRVDGAAETAARFDAPVARLDSQASQTTGARVAPSKGNDVKKKIKIGGVVYKIDADEAADKTEAVDEMVPKKDADADMAVQAAKLASMEALIAQLSKECAELKATLGAAASTPVTEASVPEAVADSIVSKRLAKLDAARTSARLVAPAVKLDGLLKPREIHAAAIALVMPTVKLDGFSDDGVAGVFTGLAEAAKTSTRTDSLRAVHPEGDGNADRADAADDDMDPRVALARSTQNRFEQRPAAQKASA